MSVNDAWKPANEINGESYQRAVLEESLGYLRPLSRMDGRDFWGYNLWHYPAEADFDEVRPSSDDYLQCAGSAQRLTLELRLTDASGVYRHWVLGRAAVSGGTSERVTWQEYGVDVHPEEVWTAEQAAPVFEAYSKNRRVPECVHLRQISI